MDTEKADQGGSTLEIQHTGNGGKIVDHDRKNPMTVHPKNPENAGNHHSVMGSASGYPQAASNQDIELADKKKYSLSMTAAALRDKMKELILDNNEHKRTISKIEAEKADLEKRYDSSMKRARAAEQIVFNLTRDIQSLGDENSQLEFIVLDLEESLQANLEKLEMKEMQEMHYDTEILQLDRNLRTLRDQLTASKSKQLTEKSISGNLKADRARLKVIVEQLQKMVVEGIGRQKRLTSDNERLQKALREQNQVTLERLGLDKGSLQQELCSLSASVSYLTSQEMSIESRISDLESKKSLIDDAFEQLAIHGARIKGLEVEESADRVTN